MVILPNNSPISNEKVASNQTSSSFYEHFSEESAQLLLLFKESSECEELLLEETPDKNDSTALTIKVKHPKAFSNCSRQQLAELAYELCNKLYVTRIREFHYSHIQFTYILTKTTFTIGATKHWSKLDWAEHFTIDAEELKILN